MAAFFMFGGIRRNQFGEYHVTSVFIALLYGKIRRNQFREYQVTSVSIALLYGKRVCVINFIMHSAKCYIRLIVILWDFEFSFWIQGL